LNTSQQAGLSSRRGGSDGSDSKPAPPAGSMGRGTGSVAAFSEAHSGQLDKLQQEKRDLRRQQLQQTERRKAARDQTDSYEAEAADRISDSNPNIRPDGAGRTRTFTAARGSGSSGGRGPGRGGPGGGRDSSAAAGGRGRGRGASGTSAGGRGGASRADQDDLYGADFDDEQYEEQQRENREDAKLRELFKDDAEPGLALAWHKALAPKSPKYFEEGDLEYHQFVHEQMGQHSVQQVVVHAKRNKRGLQYKRARTMHELIAELQMPENLAIRPEHAAYSELEKMWLAISRNASLNGYKKRLMIGRLASYIAQHGEGTKSSELFDTLFEVDDQYAPTDRDRLEMQQDSDYY
jgi:hypothetical protein